jgi:hypothetical protein
MCFSVFKGASCITCKSDPPIRFTHLLHRRNTMKTITKFTSIMTPLAAVLISATGAHAASTNKVFMSNTLIFLFLGFCALVVAIQLIPAMITLHAMIKAALSSRRETKAANARIH